MYIGRYTHTYTQAPPFPIQPGQIDKDTKKREKPQQTKFTLFGKHFANVNFQNSVWKVQRAPRAAVSQLLATEF